MIENLDQVINEVNFDGVRRFTGNSDLIVDGDQEAILELVWWVIFIVQLSLEGELDEAAIWQEMLDWVNDRVTMWVILITWIITDFCNYIVLYTDYYFRVFWLC